MSFTRFSGAIVFAAGILALTAPGAMALTAQECSAKYKTAKEANTLAGKSWNDFRKSECSDDAAAAKTEAPKAEAKPTAEKPAKAAKPVTTAGVTFPSALSQKYASEKPYKARLHTCADQYKANKASNANGSLKWIQKGGGY